MAQLLRVLPRTTSLLSPLSSSSLSISLYHSSISSSSSISSFSHYHPLIITPGQTTKEISHFPIYEEDVIQCGKYDYGEDEEKLSKGDKMKDAREERKKQKKAEAPKKERKKEKRGDQR